MTDLTPIAPGNEPPPMYHVGNSATYRVLQPLLLAAMVTAFLTGIVSLIRQGDPEGPWGPLGWFLFLVALQSALTTLWLHHPDRRQVARTQYRVAEIIVLILVARLLTWFVAGGLPRAALWRDYLINPFLLLDGPFFVYALLAFIAWERSLSLSAIFGQLALGIDEAAYYRQPAAVRGADHYNPFNFERQELVNQFLRAWLGMGVFLGICAAFTTFELSELARTFRGLTRLGLSSEMLLALVSYFLIGLWLLSQARLSAVYARWVATGVTTQPAVWQRWHRLSLWLLLAIAGIAAFLPIGSTIGLARILQAVVGVLFLLVGAIFTFFISLFSLLLSPFLGAQAAAEDVPTPAPPQAPSIFQDTILPASETTSMVMGALFLIVLVVVAAVALYFFLRERGVGVKMPAFSLFWNRLITWWRAFWQGVGGQVGEIRRRVTAQMRPPEIKLEAPKPPWNFVRLSNLSPREQIRFFYLAAVRRARERGVARAESETPLEFAQDLRENWPEAEAEVGTLTEAFLEARYSRHVLAEEDAGIVKQTWRQVRSRLRQRPKGE